MLLWKLKIIRVTTFIPVCKTTLTTLTGYLDCINTRNENARKDGIYEAALELIEKHNIYSYEEAIRYFESIPGWKDADEQIIACQEKINAIKAQIEADRKNSIYNKAAEQMAKSTIFGCEEAIRLFKSIPGWKDADIQTAICQKKIQEIKFQYESDRLAKEQQEKRHKLITTIAISVTILLIVGILVGSILTFEVIIPNRDYDKAVALMEDGEYNEAIEIFKKLDNHKDSKDKIIACYCELIEVFLDNKQYASASTAVAEMHHHCDTEEQQQIYYYLCGTILLEEKKYPQAALAFGAAMDYKDAEKQAATLWDQVAVRETIVSGSYHTIGLKDNGSVVAIGDNAEGQCNTSGWKNMVAVSAGRYHSVGLKADGTVVAAGYNHDGQCNVGNWSNIVAIATGYNHTVGLKADGTVVAVGENYHAQCKVYDWTDIVAISAGTNHTVGLKADGTVVAVGDNIYSQCNVDDWTGIVAISAGARYTVGLKKDGTVVAVGDNNYHQCDVGDWSDIVAIFSGGSRTVGLKADGTVVAVGDNDFGQCNVEDWSNIVAISAGHNHTVGLKADGTMVAVGSNGYNQCDVSDWTDIKQPKKPE